MGRLLADFGKHANPYKNPLLSSSIAFLVAFASALVEDVVYRRVDPWGNPAVWVSLMTAAVLLPTWILSTDRAKTFNETMLLKSLFRAPTVGIFTVGGKDETQIKNIMRGSSVTPSEWIQIMSKPGLTVRLSESLKPEFRVMINAVGKRYIEYDVANMGTLKQIKRFVEEGGVFVRPGMGLQSPWNCSRGFSPWRPCLLG
jgi:hypothetical protein